MDYFNFNGIREEALELLSATPFVKEITECDDPGTLSTILEAASFLVDQGEAVA